MCRRLKFYTLALLLAVGGLLLQLHSNTLQLEIDSIYLHECFEEGGGNQPKGLPVPPIVEPSNRKPDANRWQISNSR